MAWSSYQMKKFDNKNKGAIWEADKVSDKHPDLTGSINVDGNDYFISAWENHANTNNAPKYRLSVTAKSDVDFDDIPF